MVSESLKDHLKENIEEFLALRGKNIIESNSLIILQDRIIPYLNIFLDLNFGDLTLEQSTTVNNILKDFNDSITNLNKSIHRFSGIPDEDFKGVKLEAEKVESLFNKYKAALDSFYTFSMVNGLNKSISSLDQQFSQVTTHISLFENQVNESIEGLEVLAKKLALPSYATVYEKEAEKLQKASEDWLKVGIILITLFLYMLYNMMFLQISIPVIDHIDPNILLFVFLSLRMTVIVFCLFIIYFVIHKHNILKHNSTLNRARANALAAFRGFVETSKDEETRNIILLKITDFIFSASNTGYLKNEEVKDALKDTNAVLATLMNFTGKK